MRNIQAVHALKTVSGRQEYNSCLCCFHSAVTYSCVLAWLHRTTACL